MLILRNWLLHWKDVRVAFAQIGDLRSSIPKEVNVMALTATATSVTYSAVCNSLAMDNYKPTLIALPPYRDNIKYLVHPKVKVDEFTMRLCEELATK